MRDQRVSWWYSIATATGCASATAHDTRPARRQAGTEASRAGCLLTCRRARSSAAAGSLIAALYLSTSSTVKARCMMSSCGTKPVTRLYRSSLSGLPLTVMVPLGVPYPALPAWRGRGSQMWAACCDACAWHVRYAGQLPAVVCCVRRVVLFGNVLYTSMIATHQPCTTTLSCGNRRPCFRCCPGPHLLGWSSGWSCRRLRAP